MGQILCIGEVLIDFISCVENSSQEKIFYQHPGGAPANVAIGLSKLGSTAYFLGKVGNDLFGDFLRETFLKYNVHTDYLYSSPVNTTLAFVNVDKRGERSFHFYRSPGADTQIKETEIENVEFQKFRILHFGSLSLTHNPSRNSIFKAFKKADRKNKIVSFDPNLRLSLWENEKEAKDTIGEVLPFVDILRLNKNELFFLTKTQNIKKASDIILDKGIKLVIVSLGKEGVFFNSYKCGSGYVKGFEVKCQDTTGAGDALTAGMLSKIRFYDKISHINENEMKEIMEFSNMVAGLSTTQKGAVASIPEKEEAEKIMSKKYRK